LVIDSCLTYKFRINEIILNPTASNKLKFRKWATVCE
jgi:hypothetical protein